MRISIRWKLAVTYFLLIVIILGATNLFLLRVLEQNYLRERVTTYLTNANIIATTGENTLLKPDRSAYYMARDFGTRMGARVLVLNTQGRVMVDSFGEEWLQGRILKYDEVKTALSGSGETGIHIIDNEKVLYVAVPVIRDKDVAGTVMMVVSLNDIYTALGEFRRQMVLVSLVSGLLAFLMNLFFSGFLTRPVKELTEAVRDMARGRLEQHISVRSQDELGELATAFNDMSGRLAEVDRSRRQFLADASHELKSPLSSMKVLAQSLIDSGEKDPAVYQEILEDINTETDRLARIVENMLQLTRLEEGKAELNREVCNIEQLVTHVQNMMQPRAVKNGITLQVSIEQGLEWPVNQDVFTRILINLVDNALRYTAAGGMVTVQGKVENDHMIIKVADTGEGIPTQELPRIFDRFYRLDKARSRDSGGTGLGLAIVRQGVYRHGGTINVSSQPGKGTTFELLFPSINI